MYRFRLPRVLTTLVVAGTVMGLGACDDDEPTVIVELTDGNIVAVARALNNGEIMTSEVADTAAQDSDVEDFAEMMITDHTALNDDLDALGIAPVENTLSEDVAETAAEITNALNNLSGADFDLAYMEAQVLLHEEALELLDETLIPQADDDDLQLVLEEMRDVIAAHLDLAEDILAGLQ